MGIGSSLSGQIKDGMRVIWQSRGASTTVPSGTLHKVIYAFRTWSVYQGFIKFGKLHLLPFVLAAALVWFGVTGLSHLAFNIADSMGAFCTASKQTMLVNLGVPQDANDFDTSVLCAPTGLSVRAGYRYELTITVTEPWADGDHATTPVGFRTSTLAPEQRWRAYAGILLRRIMFRPWFRLIARVGEKGVAEHFLDPRLQTGGSQSAPVYKALFVPDRSGEIFLYVNDAVIGLPWINSHYFQNNRGKAKITVRLM
jgi:hypothetical protein